MSIISVFPILQLTASSRNQQTRKATPETRHQIWKSEPWESDQWELTNPVESKVLEHTKEEKLGTLQGLRTKKVVLNQTKRVKSLPFSASPSLPSWAEKPAQETSDPLETSPRKTKSISVTQKQATETRTNSPIQSELAWEAWGWQEIEFLKTYCALPLTLSWRTISELWEEIMNNPSAEQKREACRNVRFEEGIFAVELGDSEQEKCLARWLGLTKKVKENC
jgi:hypothetical protein